MSKKNAFQDFKQEFSLEVNESVFGDMLAMAGNADKLRVQLKQDQEEELARKKERALRCFEHLIPKLTKERILEILEENNWNPDQAASAIYKAKEMLDELENQDRFERKKEERLKEYREKLAIASKALSSEEIQQLKNKYSDNEEAFLNACTELLMQKKRETETEQQKRKKEILCLEQKYTSFTEKEIEEVYTKCGNNFKAATFQLRVKTDDQNIDQLCQLFPALKRVQVAHEYGRCSWSFDKALEKLHEMAKDEKGDQKVTPEVEPVKEAELEKKKEEEIVRDMNQSMLILEKQMKDEEIQIARLGAHEVLQQAEAKEKQNPAQGPAQTLNKDEKFTATVKLTEGETKSDINRTVSVEFTCENPATERDWIGWFAEDEVNPLKYLSYVWVKGGLTSGQVKVTTPTQFGTYFLAYFSAAGAKIIGISEPISVSPEYEVTYKVDAENAKVSVMAKKTFGNIYAQAWIGFFDKSETDNAKYRAYQYIIEGTAMTFDIPSTGLWELRVFPHRTYFGPYFDIKRVEFEFKGFDSVSFDISFDGGEKKCVVSFRIVSADPYLKKVWVACIHDNEQNPRNNRRWAWITNATGQIIWKAPIHNGSYRIRVFSGQELVCQSEKTLDIKDGL